ncbi:MAG TPA: H-NS family nucleoid-associated regulatory protein [Paraburkholderia sp.]|uniref:H-NS family nucleoid-associated regulatory protein n=1 Tax=Paraburkholderia sp. TaxID=1926495 RepID=UPI002B6AA61D|nr:H-NS family nucleoid-associated regulatory protein [Paraburkholderia sp.]HTR05108.1 H-NS family nucleoid-associated regulatory protein [Paraburkholderia sp.]
MDERKRDSIVAYLRRRMAELGIEPGDVAASIAADQERLRAVRYRDATGHTWDGKGDAPQWIVQATSAGQSLEHFAINKAPEEQQQPSKRPGVNWRLDPFAGTRLATMNPSSSDLPEPRSVRDI